MSYKNIKTQSKNSIGIVTISREKEKNSLDIETSREIYESMVEFDNNNSINCIVIEGNSKIFSPGADIKELNVLDSNSAKSKELFKYFDKIMSFPNINHVRGITTSYINYIFVQQPFIKTFNTRTEIKMR